MFKEFLLPDRSIIDGSKLSRSFQSNNQAREYSYFSKIGAENLVVITQSLSEHIHDNGIKALILVDRSARPAYAALREYWNLVYGGEEMPSVYFINPASFEHFDKETKIVYGKFEHFISGGYTPVDVRSRDEVMRNFNDSYHNLVLKHKNDKTLLFDTCVHTGNTLRPVLRILESVGFSSLEVGVVQSECSSLPISFITDSCGKTCYPFGRDKAVKKDDSRFTSCSMAKVYVINPAVKLRQEIKQIIRDYKSP